MTRFWKVLIQIAMVLWNLRDVYAYALLLTVLKLTGQLSWSWLWVTSPTWILCTIVILIVTPVAFYNDYRATNPKKTFATKR
jgi:hypothetical protein